MRESKAVLPGGRKGKPVGRFPIGAAVRLVSAPFGQPGIVREILRGKVVVAWPDLHYRGRHAPASLTFADSTECPAQARKCSQDAAGSGR